MSGLLVIAFPIFVILFSAICAAVAAKLRKVGATRFFFVGLLLPFIGIVLALLWPQRFDIRVND